MHLCTIPVYPAGAGYGAGHLMFSAAEAWGDMGCVGSGRVYKVSKGQQPGDDGLWLRSEQGW